MTPTSIKRYHLDLLLVFLSALLLPSSMVWAQCQASFTSSSIQCAGQRITFTNTSPNLADGSSYEWDFKDGNKAFTANSFYTYSAPGNYKVSLTRTCPGGAKSTVEADITVSSKPTPNAFSFSPAGLCSENAVSFVTTSPVAGMSYSWNFGDPSSTANTSNTTDASHIFEAYGVSTQSFNVTLTTTDNNGCQATSSNTVSVRQRPALMVSEFNNFKTCIANLAAGVSADAHLFNDTQNPSKGIISGYKVNWGDGQTENYTNATFDGFTGIKHHYSSLNRYNITIEAAGTNGCKTTKVFPYVVDANPVANLGGPPSGTNSGCGPLRVKFSNLSTNVSSTTRFFFTPGDGSPAIELPVGVTGNDFYYTYKTSCINGALQSLTAKLKAQNECDSATATWSPIRVYPQPIAKFTANAPFCKNTAVLFNNISTPNRCAANSATKYTWYWGDGSAPEVYNNIAANLSPQQTLTHFYSDTGTYTVVLRAENNSNNGCGFTLDTMVIKVSDIPVVNFSSTSQSTYCMPATLTFNNLSRGVDVSYKWSISPLTGYSYVGGTSSNSKNPQITFSAKGSYVVSLVATTPCGNITKSEIVTIKDVPTITFPAAPLAKCAPATFSLADYMPVVDGNGAAITSYSWNFNGGSSNNTNTANPGNVSFTTPQKYSISLTAGNECGNTTRTVTNFFTVGSSPVANAGNDVSFCSGAQAQLGTAVLANHTYSWSPVTGLNVATIANPTVTLTNTGSAALKQKYIVTVTANGCSTKDSVEVRVDPFPDVSAGLDTALCRISKTFQLTKATPAGGTWSGGSFVSSSGIFNTAGLNAGTYQVSYTYRDPSTSCQAVKVKKITINALPAVEAGSPVSFCNASVTETLTGSPANGIWSGTGVTASGDFNPSAVGLKTGHKLYYTFIDGSNCKSTDSLIVNVNPPPTLTMGAAINKCLNAAAFTMPNPTPSGGTWTSTPYLTTSGLFTPLVSGTGTFNLTYTSPGTASCRATGTQNVVVVDTMAVSAGSNETACANEAAFTLGGFSPTGGTWTSSPATYLSGTSFDPSKAGSITSDVTVRLTYRITDPATNCQSRSGKVITIKPVPNISLAGIPTSFCAKDTAINLGGTPTGGTWTGNGIVSNIFNPFKAGTGSHVLNYKVATGNCSDNKNLNITINPLVKPNAGSDFEICIDAATKTLTGFVPAGGAWSGPGITGTSFNPASAGAGNHQLVYTTGVGTCRAKDTLIAKVNPTPVLNVGQNPQGVCEGTPAFNLAGWSPSTGGAWSWSGTGITDANAGTFNPVVAGPGSFTLTFTFTDAVTGCDDVKTKVVNVNALPVLRFTVADTICVQKNLLVTNTSTGTNLIQSWSLKPSSGFSFTAGTSASSYNPVLMFSAAGTYQIRMIGQTGAGCIDSLKKSTVVVQPPVAKFIKDKNNGCGPLSVTFANQSTGILKSYVWSFGNGQTSTLKDPGTVIFPAGRTKDTTYYISLKLVSNNCDEIIYRDSVIVYPKPYIIFGPDKNIGCSPVEIKFKNNTTGKPDSFTWDYGDGSPISTTKADLHSYHFIYTGNNDTTYTVTLTAFNTCGTDSKTTTIKVLPNTVKAFFNTSVLEGCVPLTVSYTNFSTGGNNIKWDLGDNNVTNTVSPTHTYSTPGEYFVTLYVNNGCSYDTTKPAVKIKVNPLPKVEFTAARDAICENNNAVFIDKSVDLQQYTWTFGDGGTSSLNNPKHEYLASGNYEVILVGKSATTNCIASDTMYIDVKPQPKAQYSNDISIGCQPLLVNFKNTSTDATHYSWNMGDGNTLGNVISDFKFVFHKSGTFTAKLYSFNSIGCVDSAMHSFTVHPKPDAVFDYDPKFSCKYPVHVQTANKSTGYVSADWSFGNGQTSILDNPFVFYNGVGTYDIGLIITSDKGCKDTALSVFNAYPLPVPDFDATPLSGCEPLYVNFRNNTQYASAYEWDFGDKGTKSKLQNPAHIYDQEGFYSVKLIATGNGVCTDSIEKIRYIEVLKGPDAAFTYENNNNPIPHGEIQFTNHTTDAIAYWWNFGDGNTSTETDPVHRYGSYGSIPVRLVAQNTIGCYDTASVMILVDYYKGLWVPNALTPENGVPDTRHFLPKGKGLAKYKLSVYDQWGILIWQSDKLDQGSPMEGWDGTGQNGTLMPPDVYVWRVYAEFEDGTVWQGQNLDGGKLNTVGTVTLIR